MLSDATIDATFQYTICDTDILMPEVTLDDLRGYDGGEYSPQDEHTAAYIKNLDAADDAEWMRIICDDTIDFYGRIFVPVVVLQQFNSA